MRRWIYGGIAIAVVLGLIVAIPLVRAAVDSGSTVSCSKGYSPPKFGPLGSGKMTSITAAQSAARYRVLIPDAPAARPSNLTQTWVNNQRYVALVFDHGKVTIMMAPATYSNAARDFQRFIEQNHASAVIGHVNRQPALIISPHTDACGSNPAWVELDRAGIDVNIYSATYGTGTLLSVADSLRPADPNHRRQRVAPGHYVGH